MKIGEREYVVQPTFSPDPPAVMLKVKQWGLTIAQELVTPAQAREFARALDAAADAEEGRNL